MKTQTGEMKAQAGDVSLIVSLHVPALIVLICIRINCVLIGIYASFQRMHVSLIVSRVLDCDDVT